MSDIAADNNLDIEEHGHTPTGWRRWLYSTNHKDIGQCILFLHLWGE